MNIRNTELMKRYASHPLKDEIETALTTAEKFAERAGAIRANRDLSDEGRGKEIRARVKATLRDLRDKAAPIAEMKAKLDAIQARITRPSFDKADVVGALARQEIRAALRGMPLGDRAALLVGDGADERFVVAVLEQPPLLSQTPKEIYDRALSQHLEGRFKAEIAQGAELSDQIAEAEAAFQVARGDVFRASGLPEHEFVKMADEVNLKRNAPWLKRDRGLDGNERIIVVPLQGGGARPATPDEIRDGKFYRDFAEYQADRAA